MKIKRSYPLYYYNTTIEIISTVDGFVCDISTMQSPNEKGIFYITTINDKFGSIILLVLILEI